MKQVSRAVLPEKAYPDAVASVLAPDLPHLRGDMRVGMLRRGRR